jgi:hypothetical protein
MDGRMPVLKRTARSVVSILALVTLTACVAVPPVAFVPVCDYAWMRFNDPYLDDPIERWRLYEILERNNCPR